MAAGFNPFWLVLDHVDGHKSRCMVVKIPGNYKTAKKWAAKKYKDGDWKVRGVFPLSEDFRKRFKAF